MQIEDRKSIQYETFTHFLNIQIYTTYMISLYAVNKHKERSFSSYIKSTHFNQHLNIFFADKSMYRIKNIDLKEGSFSLQNTLIRKNVNLKNIGRYEFVTTSLKMKEIYTTFV